MPKRWPATSQRASKIQKKATKKAADDAANAAKKAAKKAATTSQREFKKMERSAKKTATSMRQIKGAASSIGRGFAEVSLIAGGTDSKFGQLVDTMAMVSLSGSAMIGMFHGIKIAIGAMSKTMAIASGGLVLLAGGAAYALGAFDGMGAEVEDKDKKIKGLNETLKEYNAVIGKSAKDTEKYQKKVLASKKSIDEVNKALDLRLKTIMGGLDPAIEKELEKQQQALELKKLSENAAKQLDEQEAALKASILAQEKIRGASYNKIVAMAQRAQPKNQRLDLVEQMMIMGNREGKLL